MTAEIAILNRNAVALAADSAVTVGNRRVWNNANKLFSLSPVNDIGIMIYGSGEFLGWSWETIIKTFRQKNGDQVFPTVSECGEDFLNYLKSDAFGNNTFNEEEMSFNSLFFEILESIKEEFEEKPKETEFSDFLSKKISDSSKLEKLDVDIIEWLEFEKRLFSQIEIITKKILKAPQSDNVMKHVLDLLFIVYSSKVRSKSATGFVISGFGSKQFSPELIDYTLDGKIGEFLRVWKNTEVNLNVNPGAQIVPFAQTDMIQLFMEGISGTNLFFIYNTLVRVLKDKSNQTEEEINKLLGDFLDEVKTFQQEKMISPVMNVISTLPKEEMAAMAEALVEITSLRRKVDSPLETVGGPTDVAVISKGDGLIWIKRKHYFDINLNHDFLQRKKLI